MGFYLKHKRKSDPHADGPEGWLIPKEVLYSEQYREKNCTLHAE